MKIRWRIAFLVSTAIAISYLDRQTLPVAIKAIEREIPIGDQQFSHLQTAFLVTYGLMYAGSGKLVDVLGTRRGFTVVMVFWSLACAAHGFVGSLALLVMCRLLLGAGEGGGFPTATRVVAEWFPVRERSAAMGIMNGGSAVGLIVAAPLIAGILLLASWRWVFIVTGTLGLLWTILWHRTYRGPGEHASLSESERAELAPVIDDGNRGSKKLPWLALLGYRQTWGVVIPKFLSDAAWYFYLFWLPKYLYEARGFDIKQVGAFAWIPPAAAGVGCLCGGWFSGWLLHRNLALDHARKLALGASAIMMPVAFFIPHVSVALAIALFAVAYFGQQSWSTLVMILPTDIFPRDAIGSVAGLVGFGGAMGGVAFGEFAGFLLAHGYGWGAVFAVAGSLHILAFITICLVIPTIRPLTSGMNRVELETQPA